MTRAVLAALLLVACTNPVGAQAPRDEALAALARRDDAEARRRGAEGLGEHGNMADVPALVQALLDPDAAVRARADHALWQVWSRSGDAETDQLFAIGVEQMAQRQGDAAVETFTRVIERRPDFAEGWNKRATVHFLLGEYDKSRADCDEVLKRNPHHYGALSGYGMIYLQLDQPALALPWFERALAVNPNLHEVETTIEMLRALLVQRRRDTI